MRCVAITGVSGALGRRIVAQLADRSDWSVIGIDTAPFPEAVAKPRHFTVHRADLRSADCYRLLQGVDVVVHLAAPDPDDSGVEIATNQRRVTKPWVTNRPTNTRMGDIHDDSLKRLLVAVAERGITQFVMMSSASVYGAYPENQIPLLESCALRPNPGFAYADAKVRNESEVVRWQEHHPDVSVAVLRPAVTLGHPDARAWLADAVRPSLADRLGHGLPAMQFVHVDDVANAVVVAIDQRLDGAFNVAADDWLVAEQAHELLGPNLRLPLPDWLQDLLVKVSDRRPGRRRPVGALPYSRHPWVVAVDRLKESGWAPQSTSAEAFVANRRPTAPSRYFAKHRQEVTLAAVATVGALLLGLAGWMFRRWRRSQRL